MDRRDFLKAGSVASIGLVAGCIGDDDDDDDNGVDDSNDVDDSDDGDDFEDEDPIVIGAIQPLSGPFSPWGEAHHAGLEFAVDEINGEGGILGREVEVVTNDSGSDPTDADSFFREFVEQDDAIAITGPVSSDVGLRTADTAQELRTPLFLHMSGDDGVISNDREFTFRVGLLPASNTMIAQAELAQERGYENIGAIIADYAWGRAIESGIENAFDDEIPVEVAPVDADDFRPFLRNLDEDIEFLIATGHPPGNFTITNQAFEIGLEPDAVTGSGFPPGVIRGALGDLSEQGYLHYHMSNYESDEYVEIAEDFTAATGDRFDTHHSYGYVTARLIQAALEDAGEASSEALTEAVRDIEFDTLYPEPLRYDPLGEPDGQVQIYSEFTSDAPTYAPDGDWGLEVAFQTDPLPARQLD